MGSKSKVDSKLIEIVIETFQNIIQMGAISEQLNIHSNIKKPSEIKVILNRSI